MQYIYHSTLFSKLISFELLYFIKDNLFSTYMCCFLDIWESHYDEYFDYCYKHNLVKATLNLYSYPVSRPNVRIYYLTNLVLGLISTFSHAIRNDFTSKSDLKPPNILKSFVFANSYYGSSLDTNCENGMSEELLQKIYVKVQN